MVAGTKHGPTLFHFVEASIYKEKCGNCFFTCSSFFPENLGTILTWKELETCALREKGVEKIVERWRRASPFVERGHLCEKEVEKIVGRWRRASPFVTWSFVGFGPLETGVSNFGDGHLNFGDGGLSLETGVSLYLRGLGLHLCTIGSSLHPFLTSAPLFHLLSINSSGFSSISS